MKKLMGLLLACILAFGLDGCQNKQQEQNASGKYRMYDGYLVAIDGNQLMVNDFIFIDLADRYWIDTLGLTMEDMPDGYYIHDESDDLLTFTLCEDTRYNFYDTGTVFLSEDDENRLYTTTDLADFLEVFDADGDGKLSRTPFQIQVFEDGQVLSISEIFVN